MLEPDEKRIRLRPHKKDYKDEMAEAVYIEEAKDVLAYMHCFCHRENPDMREIAQRYFGLDPRSGWHTWLITLRDSPVLWTDKEVPGIRVDSIPGAWKTAST